MILNQLKFIADNPDHPDSFRYKQMHDLWKKDALKYSKKIRKHLIEVQCVRVYALNHPEKSAKMIKDDCVLSLSTHHICNIINDEKVRRGMTVNFTEMLQRGTHHVLGHDGNDVVVFGLVSSIRLLAATPIIQGDGTFACVVSPFTQLYIFMGSSTTV